MLVEASRGAGPPELLPPAFRPDDRLPPRLDLVQTSRGLELHWPVMIRTDETQALYPVYEIERSPDLAAWEPTGVVLDSSRTPEQVILRARIELGDHPCFYRVRARSYVPAAGLRTLGLVHGGEEIFGFNEAFEVQLTQVRQFGEGLASFPRSYAF